MATCTDEWISEDILFGHVDILLDIFDLQSPAEEHLPNLLMKV